MRNFLRLLPVVVLVFMGDVYGSLVQSNGIQNILIYQNNLDQLIQDLKKDKAYLWQNDQYWRFCAQTDPVAFTNLANRQALKYKYQYDKSIETMLGRNLTCKSIAPVPETNVQFQITTDAWKAPTERTITFKPVSFKEMLQFIQDGDCVDNLKLTDLTGTDIVQDIEDFNRQYIMYYCSQDQIGRPTDSKQRFRLYSKNKPKDQIAYAFCLYNPPNDPSAKPTLKITLSTDADLSQQQKLIQQFIEKQKIQPTKGLAWHELLSGLKCTVLTESTFNLINVAIKTMKLGINKSDFLYPGITKDDKPLDSIEAKKNMPTISVDQLVSFQSEFVLTERTQDSKNPT